MVRLTATNKHIQILGIDSDNGAKINYDTNGLSTISQTIMIVVLVKLVQLIIEQHV